MILIIYLIPQDKNLEKSKELCTDHEKIVLTDLCYNVRTCNNI